MQLRELVTRLDAALDLHAFAADDSNNGLQVEGVPTVTRAVFGVDACQALFQAAAERNAHFVFVHHGLSWGSEPRRLTRYVADRYRTLFRHNISLYAVHLPLDAHPQLGNNAELARLADLENLQPFFDYHGMTIGFRGTLRDTATPAQLAAKLGAALNTAPQLVADNADAPVSAIAIVSGGGGSDAIEQAAESGADLLVTGELCHQMYHVARELRLPTLALGHYATETLGPKAVCAHIAATFGIDCEFVDIPTGL